MVHQIKSHIQVSKKQQKRKKPYFSHKTQEDVQIISFYVCVRMDICNVCALGAQKMVLNPPELEL